MSNEIAANDGQNGEGDLDISLLTNFEIRVFSAEIFSVIRDSLKTNLLFVGVCLKFGLCTSRWYLRILGNEYSAHWYYKRISLSGGLKNRKWDRNRGEKYTEQNRWTPKMEKSMKLTLYSHLLFQPNESWNIQIYGACRRSTYWKWRFRWSEWRLQTQLEALWRRLSSSSPMLEHQLTKLNN